MSNPTVSTAPRVRSMMLRSFVIALLITALAMLIFTGGNVAWLPRTLAGAHLHAPRLELIAAAPLVV